MGCQQCSTPWTRGSSGLLWSLALGRIPVGWRFLALLPLLGLEHGEECDEVEPLLADLGEDGGGEARNASKRSRGSGISVFQHELVSVISVWHFS